MASRSLWTWFYWWPVRRRDQALFAEALSQALAAGIDVSSAVAAAADANPSPRFRTALREMARNCRGGWSLEASLTKTRIAAGGELLAALRVGEERGGLAERLAEFARRQCSRPAARLAAAVGRPAAVTRFASTLSELLRDSRLTVGLLEDAARLASGEGSRLAQVVGRVAKSMREGAPLAEAMRQEQGTFDAFFCKLVGAADGREPLRAVLDRLSSQE